MYFEALVWDHSTCGNTVDVMGRISKEERWLCSLLVLDLEHGTWNKSWMHGHYPWGLENEVLNVCHSKLTLYAFSFTSTLPSLPYFLLPSHPHSVIQCRETCSFLIGEWRSNSRHDMSWRVSEKAIETHLVFGAMEIKGAYTSQRGRGCLWEEKRKAFLWRT